MVRAMVQGMVGVAVVVAAAGCVNIPESSSVHAGRAVNAQDQRPLSSNEPNGPLPGAGRTQIAAGYINAMLAFPPAPDTVRQFLTPEAAAHWKPDTGLVVYTDSSQPRLTERASSVDFRARALGSLDDRGSWTTALPGHRTISTSFTMEKVDGEWRLQNPLPGTFVDQDYFTSYYGSFSLYFFDPKKTILTADPVHMLRDDSLATSLVQDLLEGPTGPLAGAVTDTVPAGTTLESAVTISRSGVAYVPLSSQFLQLSADDRKLFAAQLVWTLRPLQQINAIVITVNGVRVDLGVGEVKAYSFAGFDPAGWAAKRQLYALSSQGMVAVNDDNTTAVSQPLLSVSRKARSAAVDTTGTRAAVVSADGRTLTVGGLSATDSGSSVWYTGVDVVKPSWDIHKLLWFVDNRTDGAHLMVATGPGAREVRAPGITGQQVHSIAVSRDGVRIAAVVGSGARRHLMIAVIDRSRSGLRAIRVGPARPIVTAGFAGSQVTDVSWISPTAVAALASDAGGEPEPVSFDIDGSARTPLSILLPTRPVSLAAGPNADTATVIGDAHGTLYVQSPNADWTQIGGNAVLRAPFYPG